MIAVRALLFKEHITYYPLDELKPSRYKKILYNPRAIYEKGKTVHCIYKL